MESIDADMLAALRLQLEWGADEALTDAPVDRRASPAAAPRPIAVPSPAAAPLAVPAAPAAARALATASAARSVAELAAALANFDGCPLRDTAAHTVFAEGDPATGTLIVGDVAGEDEDRSGRPFGGADGALLDRMLASIGLTRARVHIAMLVPWRPPGGRPANEREVAACLPFLRRYVALTAPRRLLVLGTQPARALLGRVPRRREAPTWTHVTVEDAPPVRALLIETPARIARTSAAKRDAWAALRLLRRDLDTHM